MSWVHLQTGSFYDVTFANIEMTTRYYDPSWWGLAEPIYISICPRNSSTTVGSASNVRFVNITATSENGIFLSGSEASYLKGLHFTNVSVNLARSTNFSGGYHDYRPGCQGLVEHRMSGIFMQFIEDVWMQDVVLRWKKADLSDWGLPLDFTSSTVNGMHLLNFGHTYSS